MRCGQESGYLLKVDLARFTDGLDVGSETNKKKSRMTPGLMA